MLQCRHCGEYIDTRYREADGSVVCPRCGAVYRPKIKSQQEQVVLHPEQRQGNQQHSYKATGANERPVVSKGQKQEVRKSHVGRIIAILLISALIGVGAYIFCSGRLDVREIIPRLSSLIPKNRNPDGNIIKIKPNRSLPTTLLSEHQSVDDSERFKLKTTEENMLNLAVGENNHLCFEAQCSEYPIEPVYLFRIDTGENIGQMRDDGEGEDKKKGDGIFTLSFNIYASEYGRIEYIARNEESSSNQITIHLYELPNETYEAIIEELSSGVKAAILSYTDLEGFIKEESRQDAISAVVSYIESQYLNGTVSEYAISEYSVSYRDSATGLCVLYEPAVKGNLSSSGIAQMILCHPHSSHDYGEGQLPPESLQQLLEYYNENLGYSTIEYPDERATPDFFTSIPKNSILIWYGHGAWCPWLVPFSFNFTSRPVLVTNQQYSFEYRLDHIDDFLTGRLGKTEGKIKLVYMAPEYIDKYCGDISGSFICLLSCHSGQNSRLADSFLKKGAEAVVGFSDTVSAAYGSEFLKYLFYYMANKGDNNDIFYMTLGDADEASKADLGNDDGEFWDKVNHIRIENGEEPYSRSFPKSGPARPVIFGNRDFSLAPSSTHEFSPMPTLMPTPEVSIATSYASDIEYLSQIYPFSFERYENNEGDSCVYNLDGKGLPGIANEYTRYGNQGIDGTTYNNGFEVWLARWNYTPEMSWVQTTYQLNGQFSSLSGKTGLIQSYNTTNFNTTVYFYDGERQLASYTLTPDNCNYDISVNLQGVNQLTLRVQDNVAVAGGTSFALAELKLSGNEDELRPPSYYSNNWDEYLGIRYELVPGYNDIAYSNTVNIKNIENGVLIFDLSFYRLMLFENVQALYNEDRMFHFIEPERGLIGKLSLENGKVVLLIEDTPNFYFESSSTAFFYGAVHTFERQEDTNHGTVFQMDSNQQYAANIFLSNFAEQGIFNNFDISNRDIDQLVDFAFLFCKINSRNETIGIFHYEDGSAIQDFYTVSLENVNTMLDRHFGIQLTEDMAKGFPVDGNPNKHYLNGVFYFPAADGEAYNRIAIARTAEALGNGTFRLDFDIFLLDIREYHSKGISWDYYSMTTDQAESAESLTWFSSGTAIVKPYKYYDRDTFQLIEYSTSSSSSYSAVQLDGFSILGSWKSIGDEGFGQAQPGMITVFEGDHCNFYSPYDTFQFYKNSNGQYQLDVTSFLFGEQLSFDVRVIDNNNIEIDNGIILTRFRRTDFEVKFADVVESIGALSEVDDSNYQSIFGDIGQSIDSLIGLYGRE